MPRIEGAYPEPIHGVSTVTKRNRGKRYAESQVNFHSDVVDKLVRRPSVEWVRKLKDISLYKNYRHYQYYRDGVLHEFLLVQYNSDVVHILQFQNPNNELVPGDNLTLDLDNLELVFIDDYTYILDKTLPVDYEKMVEDPTRNHVDDDEVEGTLTERVTHVNVTVAGEYGETITLVVSSSLGSQEVSLTLPEYESGGDDTLEQRGTTAIAETLVLLLQNELVQLNLGIYVQQKGSSIALWEGPTDGTGITPDTRSQYGWVKAEIETGQGDKSVVCINETIEKVDGLPLFAVAGTVVTVRPDPTSDNGRYYLKAEPVEEDYVLGSHGRTMEEVVWSETYNPKEPNRIDKYTMPARMEYKLVDGEHTYEVNYVDWSGRRTGDEDSCPPPRFLKDNLPILDIGYFQKRLVMLSEGEVSMSITDDLLDYWKQSAVQLLTTDPIGIASSVTGYDKLEFIATHNRDLLVGASNGQFKIAGNAAVTPQTVAMPQTTDYNIITNVKPVAIGESMYLPMSFGDSTGVQEYTGRERTNQDVAHNIATHVRGYMRGLPELMVSSSNQEMLIMTTDGEDDNVLSVYNQHTLKDGQRLQSSWSKWVLGEDDHIVAMYMTGSTIDIITEQDDILYSKQLVIRSSQAPEVISTVHSDSSLKDIYLNDHYVLNTFNGDYIDLPQDYPIDDDLIVVSGAGTLYPRTQVKYTRSGDHRLVFESNIGIGQVEVGRTFTSSYVPTRPYRRDGDGVPITTDRIRVAQLRLSIVDSYEVWMHIDSDYYDSEDQGYNSRVMNANNNLVGYEPFSTDDVLFGFSQDVKYANAEFYTDGFLALTIDGITWRGQYYQSSKRI